MTNYSSANVSVINTADNTKVATITVGTNPYGVAVDAAAQRAYVTNYSSANVSVINTADNTKV
ncbi:YncE family protein, partial [Bacillus toyonensis]|uniref:YncE family protein n=1 Tax=Bacillus toyonensis TaxID=155322 RepID=UPI003703F087